MTHRQVNRQVEKYYYGLVKGNLFNNEGSIDAPIAEHPFKLGEMTTHQKGKVSLTTYTVEQSFKHFSWVKFQLHTGRTHQIRVHCKYLGNPIVCDEVYGDAQPILLSSIKKKYTFSQRFPFFMDYMIVQRKFQHEYDTSCFF